MKTTIKKNKRGRPSAKKEIKFRTIDDAQEGDILSKDGSSYNYKILGRVGRVIFVSDSSDHDNYSNTSTIEAYKNAGYTLESGDSKEVTMSDICRKFGYNVKIKK